MANRRSTVVQDIRASSAMVRPIQRNSQKFITSLNLNESDINNEPLVGHSTSYSYNKEQLARNTSLHKRVNSMNQSLNKILPNSISQKNQEDAETSHKEEIREEKKKLNELLEPIQQWTTLEVN